MQATRTWKVTTISLGTTILLLLSVTSICTAADGQRIRPHPDNPFYWQYEGKLILLLGGSVDDNLFQLPDLEKHLDEMVAVGGNYIRNTMSDRHDKGFELYPFKKLANGKYDLGQWNNAYWKRFENMLRWTGERDIIVQIELWDRFDYTDQRGSNRWLNHPYNPRNNINYTAAESGLKATYKRHPGTNEQPFFFTVPELRNNKVILRYQIAQVDKMLSYALKHGNVLYCMDNETSGREEWGRHWARHIRKRAVEAGVEVHVTEMWDSWDPKSSTHRRTFDHPELYSFVDVSQNNHNKGQKHWDNFQWVRNYIGKKKRRPINCVKIYGADTGTFGKGQDAQERFWRNILGGAASSRFHRPDSGLGLSDISRAHLRSMRMLTSEFDIFSCSPDTGSKMLLKREDNEAYLTSKKGQYYALYFPNGGSVGLDLRQVKGVFTLRWLDILKSRWGKKKTVKGGGIIDLKTPGAGHWACLLTR